MSVSCMCLISVQNQICHILVALMGLKKKRESIFNTCDCFAIIFVTFVALFTRLWSIAIPDHVIFDEVHFGNFTNWYIKNRFHFDIHPPLGKMIMAMIAGWTQYKGDIEYGSKFGQQYLHDELFFVSQRITPAIFSAFTSPCIYAACKCLSISTFGSTCAALILTFDMSLIVEGKFILSDGVLHFFVALHIFALCHLLNHSTNINLIVDGLTLGAAAACKYTALGLIAVDGMSQLAWMYLKRPSIYRTFRHAFLILMPAVAVFGLAWIIHFVITPWNGLSYEYLEKYSSTILNRKKVKYEYKGKRLMGSSLFIRIIFWNQVMNRINMRSDIPHPYESDPKYWPFLLDRWVGFYGSGSEIEIQCMGNPLIYWSSTLALIFTAICALFGRADRRNLLLVWGWCVSYFPFILVPRTMFLYHYLIPLMFAIMNMITLIENAVPSGYKAAISLFITLACFASFLFFAPWAYGSYCPDCKDTRLWTERWLRGPPKQVNTYGIEVFNTTEIVATLPF